MQRRFPGERSCANLPADSRDFLVAVRPSQHQPASANPYLKIAARLEPNSIRAIERERDSVRIAAGRDHKVVFQFLVVAVVEQIHARIHVAILHPAVIPERPCASGWVATDQIVRAARLQIERLDLWIGFAPWNIIRTTLFQSGSSLPDGQRDYMAPVSGCNTELHSSPGHDSGQTTTLGTHGAR